MNRSELESRLSQALRAKASLVSEDQLTPQSSAEERLHRALEERRPRPAHLYRWAAPSLAAAAVLVVAVGTTLALRAGSSHSGQSAMIPAPSLSRSASNTTAKPETTSDAPTTTPSIPITTPRTSPSNSSSSLKPLINETLSDPVRAQLVLAYVKAHGYQAGWIKGTVPGSVYYAFDPNTDTYLAWAEFEPTAKAPLFVVVGMQDGGFRTALHRAAASSTWSVYDICATPRFLNFVGGILPGGGHC